MIDSESGTNTPKTPSSKTQLRTHLRAPKPDFSAKQPRENPLTLALGSVSDTLAPKHIQVRETVALTTATQGPEEVTIYAAGVLDRAALQMAPTLEKLLGLFIKF